MKVAATAAPAVEEDPSAAGVLKSLPACESFNQARPTHVFTWPR
jgi:hypothetical protein